VFTNGCFDILHAGHVRYLAQAKALGDRLVVGLNSDASVRRLKGEQRPINTLEDRATVLASLASVDWVVPFGDDATENDTPLQLISTILPDVLVKGGDYSIATIVGADVVIAHGGEVQVLTFVDGRSTSKVIRKIQDLQGNN
jgi:D-beta-D-heptose 7-phosphate kinase/D-beta-D-heptose 1-phosphate adenosyltransferase